MVGGIICLYVASFLKICICFDLCVISTQVIMKIMDMITLSRNSTDFKIKNKMKN